MEELMESDEAECSEPASSAESELATAVKRYQAGEVDPWSSAILSALAGRLAFAAAQLQPAGALLDHEDIRQQLAVEVLAAARRVRTDAEPWIPRILMERALRNVRRWRRRQLRLDACELTEEVVCDEAGPGLVERPSLPILAAVGVSPEDAEILFRHYVLGESFVTIAFRLGVTEVGLRSRAFRAACKVRSRVGTRGLQRAWLTSPLRDGA